MRTDRFKVVSSCKEFFREMRLYHRDKGKIVPLNDDVLSAVRYGAMMITKHGVQMGGRLRTRMPKVIRSLP